MGEADLEIDILLAGVFGRDGCRGGLDGCTVTDTYEAENS
jgi:hypothetical protein